MPGRNVGKSQESCPVPVPELSVNTERGEERRGEERRGEERRGEKREERREKREDKGNFRIQSSCAVVS